MINIKLSGHYTLEIGPIAIRGSALTGELGYFAFARLLALYLGVTVRHGSYLGQIPKVKHITINQPFKRYSAFIIGQKYKNYALMKYF